MTRTFVQLCGAHAGQQKEIFLAKDVLDYVQFNEMIKGLVLTLLVFGVTGTLFAMSVPEIDPASGASALAIIAAGLLTLRGRKR
jgi:hypothetical protein